MTLVYILLTLLIVTSLYNGSKGNRYLEEFKKFSSAQEQRLEDKRVSVEAEITKSITSSSAIIEAAKTSAQIAEAAEMEKMQQVMERTVAKYAEVEREFRTKLKDDVTLNIVAAAYAVARLGLPARDIRESELVRAVIAHQKSLPSYQQEAKDELPKHDGLN